MTYPSDTRYDERDPLRSLAETGLDVDAWVDHGASAPQTGERQMTTTYRVIERIIDEHGIEHPTEWDRSHPVTSLDGAVADFRAAVEAGAYHCDPDDPDAPATVTAEIEIWEDDGDIIDSRRVTAEYHVC